MSATQAAQGWLSAKEAAAYIGYAEQTLANWRVNRTRNREPRGPVFHKVHGHRIRYRIADLDDYIASNP